MTGEARRSKRHNGFLPIGVTALNNRDNRILAGPFSGRIINISRHGACLLMSQIIVNNFHLFHSIKEEDNSCIQLTINIQPEELNCKISGQPVWMDVFQEGDIRAFKIGIEFMGDEDVKELAKLEQVVRTR